MTKIKRIPYGKSDFETVNILGEYYVDKTMFIPEIERTPFVFLIRPRRFGKSLFLSTLHSYYDLTKADRFEEFYRDTWILANPTEERAKYMILTFNFSGLDKALISDEIRAGIILFFSLLNEKQTRSAFLQEIHQTGIFNSKTSTVCVKSFQDLATL